MVKHTHTSGDPDSRRKRFQKDAVNMTGFYSGRELCNTCGRTFYPRKELNYQCPFCSRLQR